MPPKKFVIMNDNVFVYDFVACFSS